MFGKNWMPIDVGVLDDEVIPYGHKLAVDGQLFEHMILDVIGIQDDHDTGAALYFLIELLQGIIGC